MGRWLRAAAATVLLTGLLVGLPVLLVGVAGWPLPSHPPDWSHVWQMLQQGDIRAEAVLKTLAVVLWALWLAVVWSFAWEVATSVTTISRGERPATVSAPLVPAGLSIGVGRLVATILAVGVVTANSVPGVAAGLPVPAAVADASPAPPPTATAPAAVAAQPAAVLARHWVAGPSDTLWDVADQTLGDGTRVDEILVLNPGVRPARVLRPGQVVELPADAAVPASRRPVTVAAPADGSTSYGADGDGIVATTLVVERGDTLWDESADRLRHAGVDPDPAAIVDYLGDVVAANPTVIVDPDVIFAGQSVTFPAITAEPIPAHTAAPVPAAVYTVVEGDTLWDILDARYGDVDADLVWDVAALNALEDPDDIDVGQVLTLPAAGAAIAPVAAPVVVAPIEPAPAVDIEMVDAAAAAESDIVDAATPLPGPLPRMVTAEPDAPPAPGSPITTSTPPASVAPVDEPLVRSESEDVSLFDQAQRTVWWSVPMGSLLAAGIVMMMRRLRGRRLQDLEPGEQLATPPPVAAGTELAATAAAPAGHVATLRALLRTVTPHARELDDPPAVRAVEVDADRVEVLFADPAPFPPAGWTTADGGRSWVHRMIAPAESPVKQLVTPALVTLGRRRNGGEVLVDVETAGSLALCGDRAGCLGLARSMVLELAAYPLGIPMDVCLVGFDVDGVEHCDRAWTHTTMTRAVRVAREMLQRTTATGAKSLLAARAATDDDEGLLDPHVFVVDSEAVVDGDEALLDELVELCQPQAGAAIVIIGHHPAAREVVEVGDDATVVWAGATLAAPVVSREAVAQVAVMFDHAANAEPEPLTPSPLVAELLADNAELGVAEPGDPAADTRRDDDADEDVDDVADGYVPPSFEVLVRTMGDVTVEGRDIPAAADIELLALLVCLRERPPNVDTVTNLLHRDRPRTIQNRVGALRARLGVGGDGAELLPSAHLGPGSPCSYRVSPQVLTDFELLEHRYQSSLQLPSGEALEVLWEGLALMTGPAFRARSGYSWAFPEGVTARIFAIVTAYATRLMGLAFEAERIEVVLETVRCAGRVMDDPVAEAPMRRVEREYAEASDHPELWESVTNALRRRDAYVDEFDRLAGDDV